MALKALICSGNDELPQHWSVLMALDTLNTPQVAAHPFDASMRSAMLHVGRLGAISAGGSHGKLWLC
jgi:hypothetical protein